MRLLALASVVVFSLGCSEDPVLAAAAGPGVFDLPAARHLYNRAAFGAAPAELEGAVERGLEASVELLLAGASTFEPVEARLLLWETFGVDHHQIPIPEHEFYSLPSAEQVGLIKKAKVWDREPFEQLELRFFGEAAHGGDPLRSRMTLFWHGHLTTSVGVLKRKYEIIRQFQWLQAEALGSFRTLAMGIVRDAAMLQYLDNSLNLAGSPNENLARELIELYTVGLGVATEQDVREAARALTGFAGASDGDFTFLAEEHDAGIKTFLGQTGSFDAEDIVRILLEQPACAERLAGLLLQEFEGGEPTPARRARYAEVLREHDYAVRPFLRTLFLDPAFFREEIRGARVAQPYEYLVSACRAIEHTPSLTFVHRATTFLGQGLYLPPTVKGWPKGNALVTGDLLLRRSACMGVMLGTIDPYQEAVESYESEHGPMMTDRAPDVVALRLYEPTDVLPWDAKPLARSLAQAGGWSDAELAAHLMDCWLPVEARPGVLAIVTDLLGEERSALGLEGRADWLLADAADEVLQGVAHLIFSLPEAQLR